MNVSEVQETNDGRKRCNSNQVEDHEREKDILWGAQGKGEGYGAMFSFLQVVLDRDRRRIHICPAISVASIQYIVEEDLPQHFHIPLSFQSGKDSV